MDYRISKVLVNITCTKWLSLKFVKKGSFGYVRSLNRRQCPWKYSTSKVVALFTNYLYKTLELWNPWFYIKTRNTSVKSFSCVSYDKTIRFIILPPKLIGCTGVQNHLFCNNPVNKYVSEIYQVSYVANC